MPELFWPSVSSTIAAERYEPGRAGAAVPRGKVTGAPASITRSPGKSAASESTLASPMAVPPATRTRSIAASTSSRCSVGGCTSCGVSA